MTYGQQGNFVIKFYESFDDDATAAGTSALLGVIPSFVQIIDGFQYALPVSGRGHNRFYHTRNADFFHRTFEVGEVIYELIV